MNEDRGGIAGTLLFAKPRRARDRAEIAGKIDADMLDIVKQEPKMNISKTILLGKQVGSGRYRVDPARVAKKLLKLEAGIQRDQSSGGRSSSSNDRSSTSSTSHDDSSS